jgi:hypothetical protein
MKNKLCLIAILAIIGFLAACSTGDDGGGTTPTPDSGTTPSGTFAITMQNDGNGTATASPNPAAQGAEVTITAEDNSGYIFDRWEVVSGGLTLTHSTAKTSIFTMPGNAVTIKAHFALIPPNTPALSLTPPTFADVAIGYAAQTAKNVTIKNEGTGLATITNIALDSAGNEAFTLDGVTSITTVAGKGTAEFTIQPKIGLAVGTYEGTITVTYDSGKKAEAEVSFTVTNHTFNVANAEQWNAATAAISGGGNDKTYDINVTGNFPISGYSYATFGNVTGLTVNIRGTGTIKLAEGSTGSLLYIGSNQTVNLKETNLVGHGTNNTSLVSVYYGTFNMSGGTISGNTAEIGGGVYVNNGSFNMSGGTVSDNTATSTGGGLERRGGGGVYVYSFLDIATFTMSGTAVIRGNKAQVGGGVYLVTGVTGSGGDSPIAATFNMNGGTIAGNEAIEGGGVYADLGADPGTIVPRKSIINMTDGTISGNTATGTTGQQGGGGVYVLCGTFTMSGGDISGNNNALQGGGVFLNSLRAIFTMTGGNISGNTATGTTGQQGGGGVYLYYGATSSGATFTMSGGSITNNYSHGVGGGVCSIRSNFYLWSLGFITNNTAVSLTPTPSNQVIFQFNPTAGSILINGSTPDESLKYNTSVYAW